MTTAPHPFAFFEPLRWLDGRPLMDTIEPYRREIFERALFTFGPDGWPIYNRVLSGRAKKNYKTADLTLAALYRFLAWPSAAGNDCAIIANDEEQASDDLSLAKKLIAVNPMLAAEVKVYEKEIGRRDGAGKLTILPAGDVVGLHGKTFLFLGFDEIHGYRNHDLFEALSPDPTRRDVLTWITSYAGLRHSEGIPLHDLLQLGKSGDDPRMLFSWYAGDYTTDPALAGDDIEPEVRANPSMASWGNDTYLADQKRRLPANKYRRLHLNLPGAPDGAAFAADTVVEAIVRGRKRLPPVAGIVYRGFVDMSGGGHDDAVLSIAHMEDGRIVVDLLVSQTGVAPFDPLVAVRKFAELLRAYGVHRVTGDRFAGETFVQAFRAEGIAYDVCELSRSHLYEAFEPQLNAGVVELPDISKLQEQLLTLVRKASGRTDHQAGDFDDWANAAAGAVVMVAQDRAPALIRPRDLYVADEAVPLPKGCHVLYAVMAVGPDGMAAAAYFSLIELNDPASVPLHLLDFDVAPLSGAMIDGMFARGEDLCRVVRVLGVRCVWVPAPIVMQCHLRGFAAEAIPPELLGDPDGLALAVAGHISQGRVRICEPAALKARVHPLRGALEYRAGDKDADPLRMALLTGIGIGLTPQGAAEAPVHQGARLMLV